MWQAKFDDLRQHYGTPITVLILLLALGASIWWKWDHIAKLPGVASLIARFTGNSEPLSPKPLPVNFRVSYLAERRDGTLELGVLNNKLSDLLIAPTGIVQMLRRFAKARRTKRAALWSEIKSRGKENHDRLHSLACFLEGLKKSSFFGKYAQDLNEIQQVVEAKEHKL